jgi:hypothetical protein
MKITIPRQHLDGAIKAAGFNRFPVVMFMRPVPQEVLQKMQEFLQAQQTNRIPDSIEPIVPPALQE